MRARLAVLAPGTTPRNPPARSAPAQGYFRRHTRHSPGPVIAVCGLYKRVPGLALVVRPSLMQSLGLQPGAVAADLRKLKGQTIGVNSPTSTGGKILTGLEHSRPP